ncbi:hypothetical protein AB0L13_46285 [Saccharopolyspora shandongensis]|uniref:hypothetical protein n=1 Tax=Saccharopolyspora shandongensis TaxID=418495 RepID=UPI00342AFADF
MSTITAQDRTEIFYKGCGAAAVDFFNAKIERYPNHLGRTVLWAGASALDGVREHPGEDATQILLAGWL